MKQLLKSIYHKHLVWLLLFILIIGIVVYLFLQNRSLSNNYYQLEKELKNKTEIYKKIAAANYLLLSGNFEESKKLYEEIAEINKDYEWLNLIHFFSTDRNALELDREKLSNEKISLFDKLKKSQSELKQHLYTLNIYAQIVDSLNNKIQHLQEEQEHLSKLNQKLEADFNKLKSSYGKIDFLNANKVKVHYFGELNEGKANGYGMGIFDSKGIYDGEWKDNTRNGKGKYLWSNGDIYEGNYKNDKRNGFGIYYFASGEKYEGNWENDLRNGKGKFYDKEGKVILEGIWINDKLTKNNESQLIE